MKNYWTNKKVLVTGGTGFIGSHVTELLLKLGALVHVTSKSGNFINIRHIRKDIAIIPADLTDFETALKVTRNKDIVLNLAAKVTGIQFNSSHPVSMFNDNVQMAKNMIEASLKNNVERFLIVSSACVYPRNSSIPTPES